VDKSKAHKRFIVSYVTKALVYV